MAVSELDKCYAQKLKELRKKHGVIQYTMASHLGFDSQQQYSDLEKGKKHFNDELLIRICALFKISILDLVPALEKHNGKINFLSEAENSEIINAANKDVRLTVYKKLFLQSKIENVETKLSMLLCEGNAVKVVHGKHKIHVII